MKAIDDLETAYKERNDNDVRFLYYFVDHIQYVILSVENSRSDQIDRFRADRYCSQQEYLRKFNESVSIKDKTKTVTENLFYAIKCSREFSNRGELTAGRISFAVASGTKITDDPHDPNFGYIPSHPPLTVPESLFRDFVKDDPVFKRASEIMPFEIEFEEVYTTLMCSIWLCLAGWVHKEGIEKTFEQFQH